MIPSAILARYARALADVALESAQEEQVRRELDTYEEICRAVPDLLPAFDSPAVPREAKERILAQLFERHPVSGITANFLRVLLDHYRLRYFHEVCAHYIRIVHERKGMVAALVRSASPLAESDLAALRESFGRVTSKEVALEVRTDPALLGGVVVQVGSTVYDGSIRTQLDEVRRCLTNM